ncbi:antirestriction protein [Escherichia coli]|nr:antirestriction protein [Escherichia coli]
MKTLSQNTTSSACAPETDLQQLVATLVPDEQRISFWPQHFGLIPQWVTLEPVSSAGWTVCAKTTAVVSGICTP